MSGDAGETRSGAGVPGIDRDAAVRWYRENRRRTGEIFGIVRADAYYDRPIPLRNPICFYEGHLPAFSINTLVKRGLKEPGIDPNFEVLFERGIDPEDETAVGRGREWPDRDRIVSYGRQADGRVLEALAQKRIEREDDPVLRRGLAVYTILEHEPMHQETLLYMWHRLAFEKKIRPRGAAAPVRGGDPPPAGTARVPGGTATLGTSADAARFGWDNEFPEHRVEVPPFEIDVYDATNRDYMEFVEGGGYDRRDLWDEEGWEWRSRSGARHPLFWERDAGGWLWRGMFERIPLPPAWPVYVSHAEAQAFARWKGRRLPTEAEFHRAAYGTPEGRERSYPWGEDPPDGTRGQFDFAGFDPVPVGSFPAGRSAWGIHDLVGNGWEWTSTVFEGFPGFRPMPSYPNYSADFFDGKHWVLKGASPATAKPLLRRGLRNWFRGNYPYVYATFRTVQGG
jgi:ergothioneine biosynthesis protein EgtB